MLKHVDRNATDPSKWINRSSVEINRLVDHVNQDTHVVTTAVSITVKTLNEKYILCTAGSITITLPPAITEGKEIIIKDAGGNAGGATITLTPNGSDTIDGSASDTITTNYGSVHLLSDGTSNWSKV